MAPDTRRVPLPACPAVLLPISRDETRDDFGHTAASQHFSARTRHVSRGLCLALAFAIVTFWQPRSAVAETRDDPRARIERMEPEQREQLRQQYQRFQGLDPAERDRLRRLHADLQADPDREDLQKVAQRYHEWLMKLSPLVRAELADLEPAQRLAKIDQIRQRQRREELARLSPDDSKKVFDWAIEHRLPAQLLASQPRRGGGGGKPPDIKLTDLNLPALRASLSDDANRKLDDAQTPNDKRQLLKTWVTQSMRRWGPGAAGGPGSGKPSPAELKRFFDELRDDEREQLLSLPRDEMQAALRQLWFRRGGGHPPPRPEGGPHRSGEAPPGRRPPQAEAPRT